MSSPLTLRSVADTFVSDKMIEPTTLQGRRRLTKGGVTLNFYRLPNLYRVRHPYVIHSKPACQQMIASSVAGQVSKNIRAHVAKDEIT